MVTIKDKPGDVIFVLRADGRHKHDCRLVYEGREYMSYYRSRSGCRVCDLALNVLGSIGGYGSLVEAGWRS